VAAAFADGATIPAAAPGRAHDNLLAAGMRNLTVVSNRLFFG
jgi:hypothetical protein